MDGPWKWSEDGLQLLDAKGRSVLRIRPSDATQEEFDAIKAAPLLVKALVDLLRETSGGSQLCATKFVEAAHDALREAGA